MATIHTSHRLLFAITVACTGISLGSELLSVPPNASANSAIVFVPPKGGAPRVTRGAASRGDLLCTENPTGVVQQIVSLVPSNTSRHLTIAEHPSVWVYVPPTEAKQAFFNLKDAASQTVYQATISLPPQPGVIRIQIPDSVAPLVIGEPYQWGLAILCSGKLRPDSPVVSGWVQRTEMPAELVQQLKGTAPLQQATLYGNYGIWYDTIATLAKLQQQQPRDGVLKSQWKQLLDSVGLSNVSSAPLIWER